MHWCDDRRDLRAHQERLRSVSGAVFRCCAGNALCCHQTKGRPYILCDIAIVGEAAKLSEHDVFHIPRFYNPPVIVGIQPNTDPLSEFALGGL